MSALDDVLHAMDPLSREAFTLTSETVRDASAELELLRDELFHLICGRLHPGLTTADVRPEWIRILRTDPERARKMGLGWAL